MKFFTSIVLLDNIVIFSSLSKRLLSSFGISISLLIAINKEIDIPKELSNLFDKEEKMTILSNSTIDVKNFILEKINYA